MRRCLSVGVAVGGGNVEEPGLDVEGKGSWLGDATALCTEAAEADKDRAGVECRRFFRMGTSASWEVGLAV